MAMIQKLPVEVLSLIVTSVDDDCPYIRTNLTALALTCKRLYAICCPILYKSMSLERKPQKVPPAAYTLLTCPHLASQVRNLELPACTAQSVLPVQRQQTDQSPREPTDRRGWQDVLDLNEFLRKHITAAMEGEDTNTIEECFKAVRESTRNDLLAMLLLAHTKNLEVLVISAVGPRDNDAYTRILSRHAAKSLTKLRLVCFGKYPRPPDPTCPDPLCRNHFPNNGQPRPDLECSYSLFADLFRLPKMNKLFIYSMSPFIAQDVPKIGQESCTFFDFVYDIDIENTTLKELYLSEEAACSQAHLDHIMAQYRAINHVDFWRSSYLLVLPILEPILC